MARIDDLFNYLQTPGLSDQQIASEIGRLGVSAQEVSQLTGVPVSEVQSRLATSTNTVGRTVTADDTGGGDGGGGGGTTGSTTVGTVGGGATTPRFGTSQETAFFNFLQTPGLTDNQIATEFNRLGLTAQQASSMTGVPVGEINARLKTISTQTSASTKAAADAKALADAQAALTAANSRASALAAAEAARIAALNKTTTPTNTANFSTFTNFLKTPGLTDQQIAAEMNRLGITNSQVSGLTGVSENDVQTRFNAVAPFSNATQGFAQNFNNYQSIPIGAQYNPAVTAGGASPYSQVMGQMRPVGNPYAGVVGNLSMGGYNPGLYDQIAAANTAKAEAAKLATGNTIVESGGDGNSTDGGVGESVSGNYNQGGMVNGLFGMNPPGPDDGAGYLDRGEYVVKKSAVNKYGKGLLDMINEGKVPAKKMKSLLG